MLKVAITCLLISAILTLPVSNSTFAQLNGATSEGDVDANSGSKPDLKQVIAENDRKYDERSKDVDAKAMEKIARQTPTKAGFSTKQKVWLVLGAVGLAALVFVLIKYGKDCKISDPPNCTPGVDELCTCREYERNN